ncbi:hypothetical protein PanWU01x14_174420 [Parasponia andersonii]|uniref:Aspartic peptidase domain containing protein n=1 Tax=Parasponia andersonii TaxID=3476 RepID=A0A2P5C8K8_PARAD|nr:hypothetical protein PanWU01x14_174420 [Parasponia andersonii]
MAIQDGKLKQYVKTDGNQSNEDATRPEKGKQTQASGPKLTQGQEDKEKYRKRTEERVKYLRGMGHSVNHMTTEESYASAAPIAFIQQDLTMLQIDSALVGRVLIEGGSSVDVLFLSMFESMRLDRNALRLTCQPLFAFNGNRVSPLGIVTLKVCTAERCLDVDFVVIDCQYSFNVIMGKGWIHAMHRVASTLHPPPGLEMSIKGRHLHYRR